MRLPIGFSERKFVMTLKYKDSVFVFTKYNEFRSNGLTHCQVLFVPAISIDCNPPFIARKKDSCWIKFRKSPKTQKELERCIGMSILSWE